METINLRNIERAGERDSVKLERNILQAKTAGCEHKIKKEEITLEVALKKAEITKIKEIKKLLKRTDIARKCYVVECDKNLDGLRLARPYLYYAYEPLHNSDMTEDNKTILTKKIEESLSIELKRITPQTIKNLTKTFTETYDMQGVDTAEFQKTINDGLERLAKPRQAVYRQVATNYRGGMHK